MSMSDVWHDDEDNHQAHTNQHVSDLAKLEQIHHNAGYLEGITASKEEYLQQGFDAEYPVGADIGLKVGRIIGKLQGLGLVDLEVKALKELSLEALFSAKYFDQESVKPTYEAEHPLISKWTALVDNL